MHKYSFVLDTSAFTNLSGKNKKDIDSKIKTLINSLAKARAYNIYCYMPPSVWNELKGMLERKQISTKMIDKLDIWLIQKSPSRADMKVPAEFLYEYIEDIRERFNKGLREAEKITIAVAEKQKTCDFWIGKLRNNYKTNIRQGMLDSIEDLEVLLLAKEMDAAIVSKDSGIQSWARRWGIPFINADSFNKYLKGHRGK